MYFKQTLLGITLCAAVAIFSIGCSNNPFNQPEMVNPDSPIHTVADVPDQTMVQYIGDAYNSISNSYLGNALQNISANRQSGTSTNCVGYTILETQSDVSSFVEKSVDASITAQYSGIKADASLKSLASNSVTVSSTSMSIVILYTFNAFNAVLNSAQFNSTATGLINTSNTTDMMNYWGNAYVKRAMVGGMLVVSYTADTRNSTTVSKSELTRALNIKADAIQNGSASSNYTAQEKTQATQTLSSTLITGHVWSTVSALNENYVVDSKDKLTPIITSFTNYYNGLLANNLPAGNAEWHVFARELFPYYAVPGSGYGAANSSQFPAWYAPNIFKSVNCRTSAKNVSTNTFTFNWNDICTFEDGYHVYYVINNGTPVLVQTLGPNATSTNWTIPTSLLSQKDINGQCIEIDVTVVPDKNTNFQGPVDGIYDNSIRVATPSNVSRYWKSSNPQDHFYTITPTEAASSPSYKLEWIGFKTNQFQELGSIPFYRFYNGQNHFYSTNLQEGLNARFTLERIIGYAYSSPVSGTVPLYRYYRSASNDHFYTTNWNELQGGANGYVYEGVKAYVYP